MKNLFFTITIHIIAWGVLLMLPFVATYQVISSFSESSDHISLIPVILLGIIFVFIFYFNYFILIPRFLLAKKYLTYITALVLAILTAFLISAVFLNLFNLKPDNIANLNPVFVKIEPIIRANTFLMLVIAIIASIALTINNHMRLIEKEKLSAQISSLKSQINPHFLFNTLNNIYATAIDKSPQTADMVDRLSGMMRYTMKDTQNDFVPLEDEISYINNYIELQKLRLENLVKFDYHVEGNLSGLEIAPMLLIPFVENAFKHGVNAEQDSNIRIQINAGDSELHFMAYNHKVSHQSETIEHNGLGIANTKHRLMLLYPTRHLLTIKDTEHDFLVSLHLDLS